MPLEPWEVAWRWIRRALIAYCAAVIGGALAIFLAHWAYFVSVKPSLGHSWHEHFGRTPETISEWAFAALVAATGPFGGLFAWASVALVVLFPPALVAYMYWRRHAER
jgi:hypothetical protein